MTDTSELPIAILAFDHRGEFSRSVYDREVDQLTPDEKASLSAAKSLIFDGYQLAASRGLGPVRSGILVDEEYGAAAVRRCADRDFLLAMPVEHADRDTFDFEYDDFGSHIESFQPNFAKALVRYNPDSDHALNQTQLDRLLVLSAWLVGAGVKFMFELIVRPTPDQLAAVADDRVRFEDELRPALVVRAITEVLGAGIHVDLWKIEGVSSPTDAAEIVEAARRGNPSIEFVILGAAADEERVNQWLTTAAATDGFAGFAIGRNIWKECVRRWLAGEITKDEAVAIVADGYIDFIGRYLDYER